MNQTDLKQINDRVLRIQVHHDRDMEEYNKLDSSYEQYEKDIETISEAIVVLADVLAATQQGIIQYIEEVVTTALQFVYGEEYTFRIEYEIKRNQAEVDMSPYKGDLKYDPKFSCGVGIADVVSFALRIAMFTLIEPQPVPVLICDEPFRNLHGVIENERISQMVKELSDKFGLQIIIVTGESSIVDYADTVFEVKQINGISEVFLV